MSAKLSIVVLLMCSARVSTGPVLSSSCTAFCLSHESVCVTSCLVYTSPLNLYPCSVECRRPADGCLGFCSKLVLILFNLAKELIKIFAEQMIPLWPDLWAIKNYIINKVVSSVGR